MKLLLIINLQIPPDNINHFLIRMDRWQKSSNEMEDYEEIGLWLRELERAGAIVAEYNFDDGKDIGRCE